MTANPLRSRACCTPTSTRGLRHNEGTILRTDPLDNDLVFGLASAVVPWFFFMPAMGAGVLECHTPKPVLACAQGLAAHVVFGAGLAVGAMLI